MDDEKSLPYVKGVMLHWTRFGIAFSKHRTAQQVFLDSNFPGTGN